jgi:hypothetical protein
MARFICWHIQEQAHGGVDANTAKLLDGLARGDKPEAHRRSSRPSDRMRSISASIVS